MPGRLYYATYAQAHALVSLHVLYPRAERAGVAERRRALIGQARGATFELVGAGAGINVPHYPDTVTDLVLGEQRPHLRSRLAPRAKVARPDPRIAHVDDGRLPLETASIDTAVCTLALCLVADLAGMLAEITRVLRPSGQLLFLERVRATSPTLARWQDRLERPWRYVAIDCHCNRDTLAAIRDAPLDFEHVERGELRKLGPPGQAARHRRRTQAGLTSETPRSDRHGEGTAHMGAPMLTPPAFQDLMSDNHCWGCGPHNEHGLRIKSRWGERRRRVGVHVDATAVSVRGVA